MNMWTEVWIESRVQRSCGAQGVVVFIASHKKIAVSKPIIGGDIIKAVLYYVANAGI